LGMKIPMIPAKPTKESNKMAIIFTNFISV
jgi:hypothetical protein